MMSRATTVSMLTDVTLDDDELAEIAGGLTKDEIRDEIHFLLKDADLNKITRREVKEHLFGVFGESIEYYADFINQCVEEYTLEKLALL
jgi:hypothetical protein